MYNRIVLCVEGYGRARMYKTQGIKVWNGDDNILILALTMYYFRRSMVKISWATNCWADKSGLSHQLVDRFMTQLRWQYLSKSVYIHCCDDYMFLLYSKTKYTYTMHWFGTFHDHRSLYHFTINVGHSNNLIGCLSQAGLCQWAPCSRWASKRAIKVWRGIWNLTLIWPLPRHTH